MKKLTIALLCLFVGAAIAAFSAGCGQKTDSSEESGKISESTLQSETDEKENVSESSSEQEKEENPVRELIGYTGPGNYYLPQWTVKQVEEITEKTDIWALGCVLYTLMFMKQPFLNASKLAILGAKYTIPPRHRYSPELVALLKKYFGDGLDIEVGTVTREHPRFDFFV